MKCSIVIPVLESHEIFARQLLHFNRILPPGFELIVLDDGSDVPLSCCLKLDFPFTLLHTNDKRPWTSHIARNIGAQHARGDYLLMTDIDHIISEEVLSSVADFEGDIMFFHRRLGELDLQGRPCRLGHRVRPHVNTFAIRRELYERMDGYEPTHTIYATDLRFREKYTRLVKEGLAQPIVFGPELYVITDQKWFHNLARN